PEKRAEKKGTEPEGLAIAKYGKDTLAFVGSERGNFVHVYTVNDPSKPVFVQMLPTTPGPEGILPTPARGLLAISSETDSAKDGVRATVAIYQIGAEAPGYPLITSENDANGKPITWTALGALAASDEPGKLYTIADVAMTPNRI